MAQLFLHLYADQIIAKYTKVHLVWLFGETASDGLICYKLNLTSHGQFLNGLSIHRIIHQLVEIPQNLVSFAQHPLIRLLVLLVMYGSQYALAVQLKPR